MIARRFPLLQNRNINNNADLGRGNREGSPKVVRGGVAKDQQEIEGKIKKDEKGGAITRWTPKTGRLHTFSPCQPTIKGKNETETKNCALSMTSPLPQKSKNPARPISHPISAVVKTINKGLITASSLALLSLALPPFPTIPSPCVRV